MEEGWTRYVLDTFEWEPITIHPEHIRGKTDLDSEYDVILFAGDRLNTVMVGQTRENTPPAYRGGIEESGMDALKEFVENGGTLILLGNATQIGIEEFGAPFTNALAGVGRDDFFCPGSILQVEVDPTNPIAWGMPETANVMFANDQVFEQTATFGASLTSCAVMFGDSDPLKSGWLRGPENLYNTIGAATFDYGEGQVVLLPLRVQRRAQTHGTFKILFNPLMNSVAR
jgi:hypothetical protein